MKARKARKKMKAWNARKALKKMKACKASKARKKSTYSFVPSCRGGRIKCAVRKIIEIS